MPVRHKPSSKQLVPAAVRRVFDTQPDAVRKRLLELRTLIYKVAAYSPGVGELTEALKWGQPAYLTQQTKSGTTIRLGTIKDYPDHAALFVHCQTNLISRMRTAYGRDFSFSGQRALLIPLKGKLPRQKLAQCIEMALRYHADGK